MNITRAKIAEPTPRRISARRPLTELHIQSVSDGLLRVEECSLYPALRRLERDKLLSAKWKTTDNKRRARIYALTKKGRRRLDEEERGWSSLAAGVAKTLEFA